MDITVIFSAAITFFLVTNPIGNTPAALALVKDFTFQQQRRILIREGIFAFLLALFFAFMGESFLNALQIKSCAVSLTGGTLLFLVALNMLFPKREEGRGATVKQEPFIVPIATPLLSGPGLLAIIMLYSAEMASPLKMFFAVSIAFSGVIGVMAAAPYLQRLLGKSGLIALEQLMGMILAMIAIEMFVNGSHLFVRGLS